MSSINLTREEAAHRASLLSVQHYDVSLDLSHAEDPSVNIFPTTVSILLKVHELGSTFIDFRGQAVHEVLLDGTDITADAVTTEGSCYVEDEGIALNNLTPGEHTLKISADGIYSRTGEGLHRFVDPADGKTYLYTQFETADAKRMYPCFDQPNLKATYDFTIATPQGWTVIGNGVQTTENRGSKSVHASSIDYPLSSYLIAVCAGPYVGVQDTWTGTLTHHPETPEGEPEALEVPLGLYTRESIAKHLDAERLFTETKQGFDYYHEHFGVAYPFNKYDQIFVPEFNAGAMENAGAVTIRDEYVFSSKATHYRYERRADTILHELAHMWFGDLVTMNWWNDLWLNESFATWAAAMAQSENTQYDTAWVTFANVEKAWAYQQDQLPTTHPVSTDASDIETVEQNFDGITYAKGASVLKQLQAYVGREEFFAGARRYFAQHRWGNARFEDLVPALEASSGRDLSQWADQWLLTTGISELAPEFDVADGTYSSFAITQKSDVLRDHRVRVGIYAHRDGKVVRTFSTETDVTGGRTEVPALTGIEAGDMVLVNDDDLTYCIMHMDDASARFMLDNLDRVEDPMARTICWSAAWEAVRSGILPAREYVRLVAKAAAAETELGVLEQVLAQGTKALRSYCDPQWAQAEGTQLLIDAYLSGATTGSEEARLIFTKALLHMPLRDNALDFVRSVADGEDKDLQWQALTALIADGAIDDPHAAVAKLAETDHSSTGALSALRAKAAIPTTEHTAVAWNQVMEGTLSNLEARSTMEGIVWPTRVPHTFLDKFAGLYFEVAEDVWERFSNEMAVRTLNGLYPHWDVSEEGLASADALLSRELSGGLRRLIAENRDRVARALRLREVDAKSD